MSEGKSCCSGNCEKCTRVGYEWSPKDNTYYEFCLDCQKKLRPVSEKKRQELMGEDRAVERS